MPPQVDTDALAAGKFGSPNVGGLTIGNLATGGLATYLGFVAYQQVRGWQGGAWGGRQRRRAGLMMSLPAVAGVRRVWGRTGRWVVGALAWRIGPGVVGWVQGQGGVGLGWPGNCSTSDVNATRLVPKHPFGARPRRLTSSLPPSHLTCYTPPLPFLPIAPRLPSPFRTRTP